MDTDILHRGIQFSENVFVGAKMDHFQFTVLCRVQILYECEKNIFCFFFNKSTILFGSQFLFHITHNLGGHEIIFFADCYTFSECCYKKFLIFNTIFNTTLSNVKIFDKFMRKNCFRYFSKQVDESLQIPDFVLYWKLGEIEFIFFELNFLRASLLGPKFPFFIKYKMFYEYSLRYVENTTHFKWQFSFHIVVPFCYLPPWKEFGHSTMIGWTSGFHRRNWGNSHQPSVVF